MGIAINSSTFASNKASQPNQSTLSRKNQDEGFSSRRCSGWKNGHEEKCMDGPFEFTSTYSVVATPDQVVNSDNEFTGGLEGAKGFYEYGINSKEDYICWNIVLDNFRGEYQSAADTATHIHEAPKGQAGPPRLAFPNPVPVGDGKKRISIGCMMGP